MVQEFKQREVTPSGQTPGFLDVRYDPDAFGAGIGRAVQQFGQTLGQVGEQVAKLQDEKRALNVQDAVLAGKEEERPWLFDPNDGAYAKQGGQAQGVDGQIKAVQQDIMERYIEQLETPQEKDAFRKMWMSHTSTVRDSVARHEMNELGTYKAETTKATVISAMQDAYSFYNDEKQVQKALESALVAIDVNTNGLPPEAIEAAKAEATSNIHLAVTSRWANEDPDKALEYYERNKEFITGKDLVTAEQLVKAGKDNRAAQQFVAGFTGTSAGADRIYEAVEFVESRGRANAISPDGAFGPMQLHHMPSVREQLVRLGRADLAKRSDEEIQSALTGEANADLNRQVGRGMLNVELKHFGGDLEAALVAYNSGRDRAAAFLRHNIGKPSGQRDYNVPDMPWLKKETEPYVQEIFARLGVDRGPPQGARMTRENWGLRNFKPQDLMGPHKDAQWVDARAAMTLDSLADRMKARFPGIQFGVNAGHDFKDPGGPAYSNRRGTRHTGDIPKKSAGTGSRHMVGDAFDVQTQGWSDEQKAAFIAEARSMGFGGIGFYGPDGHIHIDTGSERKWGRVPAWAKEAIKTPRGNSPVGGSAPVSGASGRSAPGQGSALESVMAANADLPDGSNSFLEKRGVPGAYVSADNFNLEAAIAQAQLITDPTQRERALGMLRSQHAVTEAASNEARNKIKQQAWETVINGSFDQLGAETLAQLPMEFVSQLQSYEASKAKGGPKTNWDIWTEVTLDVDNLPNINPLDYRADLADEQYKELVKLVKEAQKEENERGSGSDAYRNLRSVSDIVNDMADEKGWVKTNPEHLKLMAGFKRKMDEYILREERAGGKPLMPDRIQDIADKLLIEGTDTSKYFSNYRSGTRAMSIEDPNNFQAAASWPEIQEDDQAVLIDNFVTQMRREPTDEEALDYYNRAMVVFLGGKAEGPEEEVTLFRQALDNRYQRPVTENEFQAEYRRFLLRFLGRY